MIHEIKIEKEYADRIIGGVVMKEFIGKQVEVELENGSTYKGILEYGVFPFTSKYCIDTKGKSKLGENWGRVFFAEDKVKTIKEVEDE